MNLILALEPDPSQAPLLTSVVRRKLGATLTVVTTSQAAIVAMNQRVPDVLVFGTEVPQTEREQATAYLTSLSGTSGLRTLEIPKLTTASVEDQFAFEIRMCLAAAEEERVRAMATVIGTDRADNEWARLNDFAIEASVPRKPVTPTVETEHSDFQSEVESRVKTEMERLRRETDERLTAELRRLREEAVSTPASQPQKSQASTRRSGVRAISWRVAAAVALVLFVVMIGVLSLPHAVLSTAARNSSSFVGTAQKAATAAAKQAVAAAPVVTRRALTAAEQVIPHPEIVKPPSPAPAAASQPADASQRDTGPGFITAFSRIPMDVYSDGKRIGSTEDSQLLLASGAHQIEFVSERFHYRALVSLTIAPGHVVPYTVPLPTGELRVSTTPGTEVWVEGERIGVAPLDPIQVPIGTREIMVRDSAGGEKHQAVEVKFGGATEVSLTPEAVTVDEPPAIPRLAPLSR